MSIRAKTKVLYVVSILASVLLLAPLVLITANQALSRELAQRQQRIAAAQQMQQVLAQLYGRIAQQAPNDPAFKELMTKYAIHSTATPPPAAVPASSLSTP